MYNLKMEITFGLFLLFIIVMALIPSTKERAIEKGMCIYQHGNYQVVYDCSNTEALKLIIEKDNR